MENSIKSEKIAHTPGPWKQIPGSLDIISETSPGLVGRFIAGILESKNPGVFVENDLEAQANASLIAAAPELLAALKRAIAIGIYKGVENISESNQTYATIRKIKIDALSAIAKAEGK